MMLYGENPSSAIASLDGRSQQFSDESFLTTFFCRALYDYRSQDASSLSFFKGDIIEVLTQLESGWWDGLLNDERGWFPSNYVQRISDQEAEAELGASEFYTPGAESQLSSLNDDTRGRIDRDWARQGSEAEVPSRNPGSYQNGAPTGSQTSSDFWVPQVTPDGQVLFLNLESRSIVLNSSRYTMSTRRQANIPAICLSRWTMKCLTEIWDYYPRLRVLQLQALPQCLRKM